MAPRLASRTPLVTVSRGLRPSFFMHLLSVVPCPAASHRPETALFLSLGASSPMMAPTNKGDSGHGACLVRTSRSRMASPWRRAMLRTKLSGTAGAPRRRIPGRRSYRCDRAHRGAEVIRQTRPTVLCGEYRRRRRKHRGGPGRRAAPDGYTIMAISTGFVVNPSLYAKVPYDPIKDFAPVTLVAVSPNVVVVNPTVAAKSLPELVQLIRDNPGKYSFAGPGVGSTPHLGGELFRLAFNLDLVHVPFTGAGPAIQATVGGHTPIAFTALPPALSAVQSGQLRALGVAANERAAGMPDVRTFAEQVVNDQEADTLTGIVAPAGTPRDVIDLLYKETANAVRQPEVSERLKVLGFKAVVDTPDQFGARIKLEIEKWGKVVRNAKLRID